MDISDLSDWIWFGAVALWMLARVLPRLFRSRAQSKGRPAPGETRPAPQPRARTASERFSVPKSPGPQLEPEIRRHLQTPSPIEPK